MHRALPITLVLLAACDGFGGKNDAVQCDAPCPDGSRRAAFDAVIRGAGFTVIGSECESVCEPILPCTPPNLPSVNANGDYQCEPIEGYVELVAADDIDWSWVDQWEAP